MATTNVVSVALEQTRSGTWIVRERDADGNVETSYHGNELDARFHLLDLLDCA